ncbi:MAG: DUF2652 domain-containing protein [Chitinophagaceae bacterium]|nr:DUF2652 domain-containing protein [Chitinophagaceae bacterium]
MENKGLLFIPDISGFTKFVTQTEIEHSRLIIQELLEVLVNSNEIGLKISEIEGDAILFYRFGEPPPLQEVYRQVEKMFCEFHRRLIAYDHRRYCLCRACHTANDLTLKIISHYGEFTNYSVQNFHKLIGKDIIIAHQLLKNDISTHEYWLVTHNLLPDQSPSGIKNWMEWKSSAKETENGEVRYHFTQLSPLRDEIATEPPPRVDLSKKSKVFTVSREYDTDFITLFHASGDFTHRHEWQEGVKKVEMLDHYLPRVGMRCKAELATGEVLIYSSSYSYTPEKLEFTETNDSDKTITAYTIDILGEKRSRLTLDYYIDDNPITSTLFNLFRKKKLKESFERSLRKLDTFAMNLVIPA